MKRDDFAEIGHTGGKVLFEVHTDKAGNRSYQIGWTHSAPRASALMGVWALPQGHAIANMDMGGIGAPSNPAPIPSCFPVLIGSDGEGRFGHECPNCHKYWRSAAGPTMCPYCAAKFPRYQFLSKAQREYVQCYCAALSQALEGEDGKYEIDMDAVAAAVGKDGEKPEFYYAEEAQQNQFNCTSCGSYNDVIGKYCYCSACGTRNDFEELINSELPKLRAALNSGRAPEDCLVSAVSDFDTYTGQLVRELVRRVPIRSARKAKLSRMRFHDVNTTADELKSAFDIDILRNLDDEEISFVKKMFHRRHVYEHNGGEVDEKYLKDSDDKTVRLKQSISETVTDIHKVTSTIEKMAATLNEGFHDILLPEMEVIRRYSERSSRKQGGANL